MAKSNVASVSHSQNKIGGWAFLIGVVLAVVFGLFGEVGGNVLWLLVVIGLIVGFLNVSKHEVSSFLMSGVVLIIASAFGQGVLNTVPFVNNILDALLAIFVPATIVVAIKNVLSLARN